MRLSDWVLEAAAALEAGGVESPLLDARLLAAHALGRDRSWVMAHPEEEVPAGFCRSEVERRATRVPLAYILGRREFFGREFVVDESVLVPRQETEHLVEVVLDLCGQDQGASVLDIGTGSGCVGLTIKAENPLLQVTLSDVSEAALKTAVQNAESLGVEVEACVSDLFERFEGRRFDFVVSNPPYVSLADSLQDEVRLYEPHTALYAGESGVEVYERLAQEAMAHTACAIVLEIGAGQKAAVTALFESAGWRHSLTREDLAGIPRVVVFEPG